MKIKEFADQADLAAPWRPLSNLQLSQLEKFSKLVAAHEREECAKLFDNHNIWDEECAATIRARSKA